MSGLAGRVDEGGEGFIDPTDPTNNSNVYYIMTDDGSVQAVLGDPYANGEAQIPNITVSATQDPSLNLPVPFTFTTPEPGSFGGGSDGGVTITDAPPAPAPSGIVDWLKSNLGDLGQKVADKVTQLATTISDPAKLLKAGLNAVTGVDLDKGTWDPASLLGTVGTAGLGGLASVIGGIDSIANFVGINTPKIDISSLTGTGGHQSTDPNNPMVGGYSGTIPMSPGSYPGASNGTPDFGGGGAPQVADTTYSPTPVIGANGLEQIIVTASNGNTYYLTPGDLSNAGVVDMSNLNMVQWNQIINAGTPTEAPKPKINGGVGSTTGTPEPPKPIVTPPGGEPNYLTPPSDTGPTPITPPTVTVGPGNPPPRPQITLDPGAPNLPGVGDGGAGGITPPKVTGPVLPPQPMIPIDYVDPTTSQGGGGTTPTTPTMPPPAGHEAAPFQFYSMPEFHLLNSDFGKGGPTIPVPPNVNIGA